MKSLTREAILRMTGTEPGSGIGTPVTGGGVNTAGFASESHALIIWLIMH